jgi:hypothetical protein
LCDGPDLGRCFVFFVRIISDMIEPLFFAHHRSGKNKRKK